jgi:mRNA interferase RelE/StbE
MRYEITFISSSAKEYKHLEAGVKTRISIAFDRMEIDPFLNFDTKKLKTPYDGYRIRIGEYRILFVIEKNLLTVYSIKHRKDAYR